MNELTITTNNIPRKVLSWYDLTAREQAEFDFDTKEENSYFRYKNWCYCLADFMTFDEYAPIEFAGWQGYHGDSFFSGVVIKFADKYCEEIIVGEYRS